MKKLIIQIILAGIIIFLGYKCYESIKIPQQFKVIKEQRYARIADRLKDIRTAQEAYKGVYGKYTGSFDTLINFIKYDSVKVVRSIGSLSDEDLEKGITEAQAIKEGRIVRDTVKQGVLVHLVSRFECFGHAFLLCHSGNDVFNALVAWLIFCLITDTVNDNKWVIRHNICLCTVYHSQGKNNALSIILCVRIILIIDNNIIQPRCS